MPEPIQSRPINIPANQIIAPAAAPIWQPSPVIAELVSFLKNRIADDRRMVDSVHCPVTTGAQHQAAIGGGTTALVPLGRFKSHLDAVERLIVKYEVAVDWTLKAIQVGESGNIHQAAAVAYMDAIQLHALEYATHPDYKESWRP